MQFPVPQFTDVEDKIIGPLGLKQFGIIFGVGIILFLGFSATKSVLVLVFLFVLFGLPGLVLAFGNLNGRPMYNAIGFAVKFYAAPKLLIFHKEAAYMKVSGSLKDAQLAAAPVAAAGPPETTESRLHRVEELLNKTSTEENDIAGKIK